MKNSEHDDDLSELMDRLADRFGISSSSFQAIVDAVDMERGTMSTKDLEKGLAAVTVRFVDALGAAPKQFCEAS